MSTTYPFTTIEEFLFWEDRPAYPWNVFLRSHLSGPLDRAAFEAAVHKVIQRHPLLTSTVQMRGRSHLQWVVMDEPRAVVEWESGPTGSLSLTAKPLDLFREPPVRFHVVSDGHAADLTVQFHHACCDGLGMLAVVEEVLIVYARTLGGPGESLQLPPLDSTKLALRGRYGLTLAQSARILLKQAPGVLGAHHFFTRSPVPIVPHQPWDDETAPPSECPTVLSGVLEADETARLRAAASRRGVRLNDWLVTDLFLALGEWRTRQNIPANGDWLRMMVPVNLRPSDNGRLPASCLASSVFIDRRHPEFAEPDRLLRSIHREMSVVLSCKIGFTFVLCSQLLNLIPGELKRRTRAPRCNISCIFTNLGVILPDSSLPRRDGRLVAGNVIVEHVDLVAPNRPYACVTFAAQTYADRLSITLQYDPRPLTRAQATDLLDIFLRRLRTP